MYSIITNWTMETLTDKPCIVLLTHGHVDHAMGAPEFDTEIYMNPADNAVHDEHIQTSRMNAWPSML